MRLRGRSDMNKPSTALPLFLAAVLLLPGIVSSQIQTQAGEGDVAPRGFEGEQNSAPSPAAVPSDKAQVTGLRFLSSKAYTRVMLDLSQEAKYEIRQLKEDAAKGTPPRIYIDLAGARLALTSKEAVPVEDGLLKQIRIGQFSPDVVRVVLDMHSLRDHNAFILPDPYRLVVDLQGQKAPEASAAKEAQAKKYPAARKPQSKQKNPSPSATLSPGIRKIVLDPGHGGKDPGAIGIGGSTEKDIVLSVAKKLAVKLRKAMGVQVVLTRNDDRFVALENRTAVANAEDADLFISLHMNASPNGEAKGIETYYLDNTSDEAALRLAARENGTSRKNVSDLQFILSDMAQNMKLEDSITLAHRLQGSAVAGMTKAIGEVKDLGVKKALFYVLVGARMPSVLVEMFFITNRTEGRAMSQEGGQDAMVEALMQGIQKYAQSALMARTL
jgi:N-acetylmuramoyl-L-alanine amidase